MNKLYILLFLIIFSFSANAQAVKGADNFPSDNLSAVKALKFYPNPASAVINFEFLKPLQREYVLQVFNFVGKKVYEQNSVTQKTIIPLTEFFRGIYIFQLRDKSGRIVESGKFQVIK